MSRNARVLLLLGSVLLSLVGAGVSRAAVLFSSNAEAGACNTGVASSLWNYTESGDTPNSRMFYRCDTPVPNSGRSKYFRIDTVNGQHDSWNQHSMTRVNLTPGVTYYLGAFMRFDRIGGIDVWHDVSGPDSYDKLLEFDGNLRWIILTGWPNSNYSGSYDHKFTFDLYSSPTYCSNCGTNEKWATSRPTARAIPSSRITGNGMRS